MKQILLTALALLLSLFVSVVSVSADGNTGQNRSNAKEASAKHMSRDVHISGEASKTDDDRVVVTGKTNLPDNTILIVSLYNEVVGFSAQIKSIVSNGHFSAGPLGAKSGLPTGSYVVEIVMPVPSAQPVSVQSIVGNEGQHLSGSLVSDSEWGGKTVEYSFPYSIGTAEDIQQSQNEHVQLVYEVRSSLEQLLRNGRDMEIYRNTDDHTDVNICREMMLENQANAREVESKAEGLAAKYLDLKVATMDIYSCVSCSRTAIKDCKRVAESLKNSR